MLKSFENFMSLVDRKNLRTNAPKRHDCRLEILEERALLSAVPLSAQEYADLRGQYAEFNLSENMEDMNVITLDLAEGDDLAALKSAITTASQTTQSDLIVVRTSTDASTLTYTASTDELTINIDASQYGSVSIIGLGDSNFTLDAAQLCRVMTVNGSSKANLGGLTIQNGKANNGGGIYVNSGNLQVSNSIITNNTATASASNFYTGGGICVNSGNLTVSNSEISRNTASGGGGISNGGTTNIMNCVITGNSSSQRGGGIYNSGGTTTVSNSSILNNTSGEGGGIYGFTGTFSTYNSVIANNRAASGGGVFNNSTTITITNCTISGNVASSRGGGIFRDYGTVNVSNSIVNLNYASKVLNNVQGSLGTNKNNITSYFVGFVCEPKFDSNYNLINADAMDLHLRSDSIAIDKGDNATGANFTIDFEGNSRFYGERVDIGAYEYQGDREDESYYSTVVTTLNDSFDLTDDEWSLREAIYYAPEYVTITFADGLEGTIVLSQGQLRIEQALAIDGDDRITIDGNQKSRVLLVNAGTASNPVRLDNLTIQNGQTDNGGGIYVHAGNLQISNSTISGNTVTSAGGGIYVNSGTLQISNSTISRNTASYSGGGIDNNGTLTITNSEISGNTASSHYGGGIHNSGTINVIGSTISGNAAMNEGGGVKIESGSVFSISNSLITENMANNGGGIFNYNGTATITNSAISGNLSTNGGGIYNAIGKTNVINSTIAGNRAYSTGGGIYRNNGTVNVTNSIISLNYANKLLSNVQGALATNKNNITSYFVGFVSEPQFDSNYNLINGDTMDLHLRSDSIAIDKGDNTAIENYETDIEGNTRIYGETVDVGAYEYQGDRNDESYYSTVVTTLNDSFDLTDDEWSLREAIYYAPEYVTITFADGLEGTIVLSQGQLRIEQALAIDGDDRITIDGNQKSRVLLVNAGTASNPVRLDNLTIQNGKTDNGGGIYVNSGNLQVTNSMITRNSATGSDGGGIYNKGTATITNSEILRNTAISSGGGIYSSGSTNIIESSISANTASIGAGITANSGTSSISGSTISGNTASSYGGGIYNKGTTTITNSEISGNTASSTGGGINNDGTLNVRNCTIAGNKAKAPSSNGGGICHWMGTTNVYNSTIAGNTANSGGGIYRNTGTVNVTNSIITCNTAGTGKDVSGSLSGSNNLSSYTGWNGSDNQEYHDIFPLFVDAPNQDYRIVMGSQAFNKGNNDYAFSAGLNYDSLDVAGNHRFVDGVIDIGAYECYSTAPSINLNKVHTGKLTTEEATNYWSLTVENNTTISFDLLKGSFEDISVSISSGAEISVLTADSGEITLTNAGAYYLKLSSSGETETEYAFRVNTHTTQEVTVDQVIQGTMIAGRYSRVYEFTTEKGESLQFILKDLVGNNRLEMYLAYGRVPSRLDYDMRAANDGQAVQTITTDYAPAGTYYVLVYGDYVPVPSDYTLEVNSTDLRINTVIRNVLQETLSEEDDLVLFLDGFWMEDISKVELVDAENRAIEAQSIETITSWEQLNAAFDSSMVTPGTYSVRITNESGKTTILEAGFIRPANEKGEWKVTVDAPSRLNNSLITQVYVTYTNTGNIPVVAPLATLTARQGTNKTTGAFLTLDSSKLVEFSQNRQYDELPDGFGHEVSFLADGQYTGMLLPGESVRLTVYYAGWLSSTWDDFTPTTFSVSAHFDSETTAMNWESRLIGKLTEEEREEYADYLDFMTPHLGATWGEHVVCMNRYAAEYYISESHENDADYIEERLIALWDSEWLRLQEEQNAEENPAQETVTDATNVISPDLLSPEINTLDSDNAAGALNGDLAVPQFYVKQEGEEIKVYWDLVENADQYQIYVSESQTFEISDRYDITANPLLRQVTISSFQQKSLLTQRTYYFKVVAVHREGEEETNSTSAVKSLMYQIDIPGLVYVCLDGRWEVAHNHLDKIDSSKYTYVIIHGNANSVHEQWISEMAAAIYSKQGDSVNILAVDWGAYSTYFGGWDAVTSANILPSIASIVSLQLFLDKGTVLHGCVSLGLSASKIHLIGHSHGAHIAGLVGNYRQVDRITALDASEELSHIWSWNQWGLDWGTWSAKFIDFYKSSRLFGGETAWGHDNFLVTRNQISTIHLKDDHGYACEWFTNTITNTPENGSKPGFWWKSDSRSKYLSRENGVVMAGGGWIGLVQENSINIIQGMTIDDRWYRDYSTLTPTSKQYDLSQWYCVAGFAEPYYIEYYLQKAYEIQFFPWDKQVICGVEESDFQVTVGVLDNLNLTCVNRTKVKIDDVLVRLTRTGKDGVIVGRSNVSRNDYYTCTFEWDVPTPELLLEQFGEPETTADGRTFYELNMYVKPGTTNYKELYPSNDECCMVVRIYLDSIICKACDDQTITGIYKKDSKGNETVPDPVSIKLTGKGMIYENGDKKSIDGYYWYDLDNHEILVEKHTSTVSPLVINYVFPEVPSTSTEVHHYRLYVLDGKGGWAYDDVQVTINTEKSMDEDKSPQAKSRDPNELLGPSGNDGWIYGEETLAYQINYENDETATAPAQRVEVEMYLDEDLDWSTFQFTSFGWADIYQPLGNGAYSINKLIETEVVPLGEEDPVTIYVEVTAGIDLLSGRVYASFQTLQLTTLDGVLDEEILLAPMSADIGFLLPSVKENGEKVDSRGDGFLTYIVKAKKPLVTNTEITSVANIQFDYGEIIATNQIDPHDPSQGTDPAKEVPLKIDADAPTAILNELPEQTTEKSVSLSWTGQDEGSGIAFYDLYVSINGRNFELIEGGLNVTEYEYTFPAKNKTYSFKVVATDNLGWVEFDNQAEVTINYGIPTDMIYCLTTVPSDLDSHVVSANESPINEWNTVNLEFWSDFATTETFTVTYDSTMYELNEEASRNQAGVVLTFGESQTDENGLTTVEITIGCTENIEIGTNTLLASLAFTPIRNMLVGESVENPIFVNSLPLDTTVYSVIYDLNESGSVEINDLVAFARLFGQKTAENPDAWKADFNCDERVDISDLVLFARNFGLTTASSSQIRYDANYTPHVEDAQPAAPALPALETSVAWETPTWSGTTQNLVPEPAAALPTITDRAWNDLWSELEEEEEERLAEQLKTAELAWF